MNKTLSTLCRFVWIAFLIALSACVTVVPAVIPTPTETPGPTTTPAPPMLTLIVPNTTPIDAPVAPNLDQQRYLDPDGWFSVNIPVNWKAKSSSVFSGNDGFFEADYLPKMMFMRQPANVCQWLANIDSKATYWITLNFDNSFGRWSNLPDTCTLKTLPGISPATTQIIIENPQASNEQRFLLIKADSKHFDGIIATFFWLRTSVGPNQKPVFQSQPLPPEDVSFWENTTPLSAEFTFCEYALFPDGTYNPFERAFMEYIPADAPRVKPQKANNAGATDSDLPFDKRLQPYGYELKIDPTEKTPAQLYKNKKLLFTFAFVHAPQIFGVYNFSLPEKSIEAFVVRSIDSQQFKGYLVQNDSVIEWGGFNDPRLPPILHEGNLFWVRTAENSHIQVQTSQKDVVFSFASYNLVTLPIKYFRGWNNHWILGIDKYFDGFLVVDGEIINGKFGFEEAFGWQLVKDKPFYFFRKGQRVGISYDGKFLPLGYDEIAHGLFNDPLGDGSQISFFGKRDGIWYYVIVKAK